ncbi:hypothetical protein [Aliarcobacter butzleri]|uniref:hypothetical protein n=1 Tax=Aliarcobacter butzleri TaxID=28197 RepID=UPI00263D1AC0|nr:hypothetical protein [Aliarcobacter butzleri]MDN5048599.1 hypothetical protein [Aliarcobacter butzleri]MDN5056701.1 hypothetical protein [Aliarcobacter butzleri]
MKEIRLILTNNVSNFDMGMISMFENHISRFDKIKSNREELKKIVIDINKSQDKIAFLITNEEKLFEFFNRNIICEKFCINDSNQKIMIKLDRNPEFNKTSKEVRNIFDNNIKAVLNNYGNIFEIDIEKLVKGTTYKVKTKIDLINLINEDLNLIVSREIVTSRLCIIFYRLTYFDLDASKVSVGRFFANHFEKSESFKINLNRNSQDSFFTDLNNKIFRGYRIIPKKLEISDIILDLKIKIAKNLLLKNVKLKIIAESIEIEEKELKKIILGQLMPIKL